MCTLRGALQDESTDILLGGEVRELGLDVVEEIGDAPPHHLLLEVTVLQQTSQDKQSMADRVDTVPGGRG